MRACCVRIIRIPRALPSATETGSLLAPQHWFISAASLTTLYKLNRSRDAIRSIDRILQVFGAQVPAGNLVARIAGG